MGFRTFGSDLQQLYHITSRQVGLLHSRIPTNEKGLKGNCNGSLQRRCHKQGPQMFTAAASTAHKAADFLAVENTLPFTMLR